MNEVRKVSEIVYRTDLYPRIEKDDDLLVVALRFIDKLGLNADIINGLTPLDPSLSRSMYRNRVLNFFGNKCFVCGYQPFVDVHHVSHKAHKGTDRIDNLVVLCPNHHKEWHYIENTFKGASDTNAGRGRYGRLLKMESYITVDSIIRGGIPPFFIQIERIATETQL